VAWLFTKTAISGGPVSCTRKAAGRWRCLTAEGSDLGSLLVQTGQARAADPYYRAEEAAARAAAIGLWRTAR